MVIGFVISEKVALIRLNGSELKIDSTAQYEIVSGILKQINLPGSKSKGGFKIYGYVPMSQYVEYI